MTLTTIADFYFFILVPLFFSFSDSDDFSLLTSCFSDVVYSFDYFLFNFILKLVFCCLQRLSLYCVRSTKRQQQQQPLDEVDNGKKKGFCTLARSREQVADAQINKDMYLF